MKKFYLLALLTVLVISDGKAQLFEWAKTHNYNGIFPSVAAGSSIIASTGIFNQRITIGSQTLTNPDSLNLYLAVYDHQGNGLWGKHIISNEWNTKVTVDPDQHILVAGTFTDSLYIDGLIFKGTSPGSRGVFLVKFDTFGNLIWARSSVISKTSFPENVAITTDVTGNICLAGTYNGTSIAFGPQTFTSSGGHSMAYLVKYDASGAVQWGFNQIAPEVQTLPKVKMANSGEVYFGYVSNSSIGPETGIKIYKLSAAGLPVWNRIAINQVTSGQTTFDMAIDNSNNVYIVAETNQNVAVQNGPNTITVPTNGNNSCILAKLSPAGNWTWINSLASGYVRGGSPSLVYSTKNNQLVLSGSFGGTANFKNIVTLTSPQNRLNSFVAALDTASTPIWANQVNGTNSNFNLGLATANGYHFISGNFQFGAANFNSINLNTNGMLAGYLAKLSNTANQISGTAFIDSNNNGTKDPAELPYPNLLVESSPGSSVIQNSNISGNYNIFVPGGTVNVNVVNPPRHHVLFPASHTVTFTGQNQVQPGKDFALQPMPNRQDVQVTVTNLTPARPGFDIRYRVTYRNMGTTVVSDSILLKYDATYLTLIGSSVSPVAQAAGKLAWYYQNLQPYEQKHIDITLNVDRSAWLGSSLQTTATIKPLIGDLYLKDNYDTINFVVTGAYDPNDKQVNHRRLSPAQIANDTYLDYVIRFQNTGTDTAFTVIIRDSISTKLQLPTFELLSASHPYTFRLLNNGLGEWRFDNILLPDSNRNEPASHGFIRYRIKPKNTLVLGDEIKTRAGIYFDFNAAVMTNYAVTKVANPTGIKPGRELQPFQLYPNPAQNYVMVAAALKKPTPTTIRLVNMLGQKISEVTLPANNQVHYQLPLRNLPKGVYLVQLETETGRLTRRLVIQ